MHKKVMSWTKEIMRQLEQNANLKYHNARSRKSRSEQNAIYDSGGHGASVCKVTVVVILAKVVKRLRHVRIHNGRDGEGHSGACKRELHNSSQK